MRCCWPTRALLLCRARCVCVRACACVCVCLCVCDREFTRKLTMPMFVTSGHPCNPIQHHAPTDGREYLGPKHWLVEDSQWQAQFWTCCCQGAEAAVGLLPRRHFSPQLTVWTPLTLAETRETEGWFEGVVIARRGWKFERRCPGRAPSLTTSLP